MCNRLKLPILHARLPWYLWFWGQPEHQVQQGAQLLLKLQHSQHAPRALLHCVYPEDQGHVAIPCWWWAIRKSSFAESVQLNCLFLSGQCTCHTSGPSAWSSGCSHSNKSSSTISQASLPPKSARLLLCYAPPARSCVNGSGELAGAAVVTCYPGNGRTGIIACHTPQMPPHWK